MLLSIVSGLLLAAVAPPPQPAATSSAIIVTGTRKKWDPDRVVCKDIDLPGSRLNTKRICRTMLQWASDKREDQQLLIQKQYNGAP